MADTTMLTSDPATDLTSELQKLTIAQLLGKWARETPKSIAIVAPGRSPLTYFRLIAQIEESVRTLNEMGLGRNDRIAIVLPNGPEMAVAFLAAGSAATCAPLNPAYRASEFDFYLNDLHANALIVQSGVESPARTTDKRGIPIIELPPCAQRRRSFTLREIIFGRETFGIRRAGRYRFVLHTSGTTRAKIIPLTHQKSLRFGAADPQTLELAPGDRCLNVMPLFHIHGLIALRFHRWQGGASCLCSAFTRQNFSNGWMNFRPSWVHGCANHASGRPIPGTDTHREIIERLRCG
jgi:acyl-CoA synthetase (AMP-forming)/AMP-acid ligase II